MKQLRNSSSVMETGYHLKKEVSLRSQTIRWNCFLSVAVFLLTSVFVSSAYASGSKGIEKSLPAEHRVFLCFDKHVNPVENLIDTMNLVNTMSAREYRELNELITLIDQFPSLACIVDDETLIECAAYVTTYREDDWGESGSKEAVEAILRRYFGVEKVIHEKSSLYRSWTDWDVDYPIDGIGSIGNNWANVTKIQNVGNGTFIADVDSYYSFGMNWDDSWLGPVSKWKLKKGAKIINTDHEPFLDEIENYEESVDIYRIASNRVTIKPFTFKGVKTWQIVAINDYKVPKILFSEPN